MSSCKSPNNGIEKSVDYSRVFQGTGTKLHSCKTLWYAYKSDYYCKTFVENIKNKKIVVTACAFHDL